MNQQELNTVAIDALLIFVGILVKSVDRDTLFRIDEHLTDAVDEVQKGSGVYSTFPNKLQISQTLSRFLATVRESP